MVFTSGTTANPFEKLLNNESLNKGLLLIELGCKSASPNDLFKGILNWFAKD